MSDIYERIWDADQRGNGIPAIDLDEPGDPARGYVRVALGPASKNHRILPEVVIPEDKRRTYALATRLFDNYALAETDLEAETERERDEVHELLEAVLETPPMMVAKSFVEATTGATLTQERWYATLLELWFRRFSLGSDPALSGFEHVFVGEQERGKVQGYHFWYKYFLDDGLAREIDDNPFRGLSDDRIEYVASVAPAEQRRFLESVTISFKWTAPDYERQATRPLTKPRGGFFVGCSVEGLMALGAVRAHLAARAPKEAVIRGARYDLKIFRSADNKNIRSFYPVFLGAAAGEPEPVSPTGVATRPIKSAVRIVAALVNPAGTDPGREAVTLLNAGRASVSLAGHRLVDKTGKHFELAGLTLAAGHGATVTIPEGDALTLSNRGGELRLVDPAGNTIHRVSYTKAQASREGETIVF